MIYHHGIIGYLPYTLQTWNNKIQIFKSEEYILLEEGNLVEQCISMV